MMRQNYFGGYQSSFKQVGHHESYASWLNDVEGKSWRKFQKRNLISFFLRVLYVCLHIMGYALRQRLRNCKKCLYRFRVVD